MGSEPIRVLISGFPGKMATAVSSLAYNQPDMLLLPDALTGPDTLQSGERSQGFGSFCLFGPERHQGILEHNRRQYDAMVVVDFTQSESVLRNGALYVATGCDFVMGTTGGDRGALLKLVQGSRICAVVDVNMAAPIVVLRAMLEHAAAAFPGALSGLELGIVESHQKTKKDVSGTAIAFQGIFEALGAKMASPISSIREREEAHGHHRFTLTAGSGFKMEFVTQVEGRQIYALGTLAAIRFLRKRVEAGERGQVFTMVDVLKGGA